MCGGCCCSCLRLSTTIPGVNGKYQNIGVLPFRFPGSTFTKIFYPAENNNRNLGAERIIKELYGYNSGNKGKFLYTRPDVIKGIYNWVGGSETILNWSLGHNKIDNFKFMLQPKQQDEKFPIVIFSHGLGGNADIYSKICSEVASLGYFVVALEHEDGSGSFAINGETGEKIYYKSFPTNVVYTREDIVEGRKSFLEKRKNEIKTIVKFLKEGKFPEELFKLHKQVENSIFNLADNTQFHMMGHSFGAATTMAVTHELENVEVTDPLKDIFKTAILLDVWSMPVNDEILNDGIKAPVISFLSGEFHENNDFYPFTQKGLKNSNTKFAGWMENTTHSQYSDGPWFSGLHFINRRNKFEGTQNSIEFYSALLEAIEIFLKNPDDFSKDQLTKNLILEQKLE